MGEVAGYSRRQVWLHWGVAALVVWQYVLNELIARAWGVVARGGAATPGFGVYSHVVVGGLILVLMVWRLALRLREGAPPPPEQRPGLRALAGATHWGLYALLLLMPISGLAAWFGGIEVAAEAHSAMQAILLALVALHVAAALAHRFVFRSGVMERMLRPVR